MKLKELAKLAIIAIACVVLFISGCDEGMTVGKTALLDDDTPVSIPTTQAELKAEPGETAAGAPQLDWEKILTFPGEDATDEERQHHGELVEAAAVNVNLLDISGCTPDPLVIEVGYGESIEIKNSDETDHTLDFAGNSVTIPAGTSRGLVVTEFVGIKGGDGVAGYGCNGEGGIFYINSNLTVKPSEKQRYVTFKLIEFLYPDGRSGPGVEGVEVTLLDGSGETRKTASDGSVIFKSDLPLTVLLEKEGYITEMTVREDGEEIVLPDWQRDISFKVVEPLLPEDRNGPGIEGVTVTCLEGSDEGIKETAADGSVTFFGTVPLTIRIEKPGYITTQAVVATGSEIVFPNAWPEEVEEAIRQLGLAERIASGKIILRWGDEEYLQKTYGDDVGGLHPCPNIIVKRYEDRNFMVWILVHELMHAWQACGNRGTGPPLWFQSDEGKAWIVATEKDIEANGPIPGFDDRDYHDDERFLSEIPWENQAMFYSNWYMGFETDRLVEGIDRKAELEELYRLAPNRCQYLEDRFGPPPPRQ